MSTYTPPWITPDGERRLTLDDLKDITSRTITVIESYDDAVDDHNELLADLRAVVSLCEDAAMTAGSLTLPYAGPWRTPGEGQ